MTTDVAWAKTLAPPSWPADGKIVLFGVHCELMRIHTLLPGQLQQKNEGPGTLLTFGL